MFLLNFQKKSVFVIGASKLSIIFRFDVNADHMLTIPVHFTPSLANNSLEKGFYGIN